jgi:hypothetical protein
LSWEKINEYIKWNKWELYAQINEKRVINVN